jgi:integrase/recombinase XerD
MEGMYSRADARSRFLEAPFLKEREQFLSHLLGEGHSLQYVKPASSLLISIIKALDWNPSRGVSTEEIRQVADRWMLDNSAHRLESVGNSSRERFLTIALKWLRFHKTLVQSQDIRFAAQLARFSTHLHESGRIAKSTHRSWCHRVKTFLMWLGERHTAFSLVSLADVDEYIEMKISLGWKYSTVATACKALRKLFLYAEREKWCKSGISQGINSPRTPHYNPDIFGPAWHEVRNLLNVTSSASKPTDLRAHAILCLCSIYAMRAAEISDLQLRDLDWENELFTIRRAKSGRVQQYPLQYEVGEAIIKYLQKGRPHCDSRHVFLSLSAPYRPMGTTAVFQAVSKRMKQNNVVVTLHSNPGIPPVCFQSFSGI